jgi:hypothetical protein
MGYTIEFFDINEIEDLLKSGVPFSRLSSEMMSSYETVVSYCFTSSYRNIWCIKNYLTTNAMSVGCIEGIIALDKMGVKDISREEYFIDGWEMSLEVFKYHIKRMLVACNTYPDHVIKSDYFGKNIILGSIPSDISNHLNDLGVWVN